MRFIRWSLYLVGAALFVTFLILPWVAVVITGWDSVDQWWPGIAIFFAEPWFIGDRACFGLDYIRSAFREPEEYPGFALSDALFSVTWPLLLHALVFMGALAQLAAVARRRMKPIFARVCATSIILALFPFYECYFRETQSSTARFHIGIASYFWMASSLVLFTSLIMNIEPPDRGEPPDEPSFRAGA